jgi:hypothetical protein
MDKKHTPGPWYVEAEFDEFGTVYAIMDVDTQDREEIKANCRLIAAAPDLLEVLIEVEQMIHANEMNEGTMGVVRIAIAKAIGEA